MADEETVQMDEGVAAPVNEAKEDTVVDEQIDNQDEEIPEEQIPIRNNASQIIARKNRQLEKLRSKQEEDPDDFETPSVADPRVDVLMEHVLEASDRAELTSLITDKPEAKKYENQIKSYMKHPSYKDVPVAMIYAYLSSGDVSAAKAKEKAVADKEAAALRGAGNTHREVTGRTGSMPTPEEISNMDDTEFDKLQREVAQGKFKE